MHYSKLAYALVAIQPVAAHTAFTTLFINDVNQGDATCIRMFHDPQRATDPVNDLSSQDMACGFDGTVGVSRVCSAQQNSKLTFEYRIWPDASQPGTLDPSHKGPCAVYMKSTGSAISDKATGDGWFKIWDEGYDAAAGKWCTEKVIDNEGLLSVKVPEDLAGGNYLVRSELISLQQADKSPPNPQFYVGCAQIFLESKATTLPQDTVSIPGYVTINDPSVLFSIYDPKPKPYTTPGPPAYQPGVSASTQVTPVTQQTEGLLPAGTVLTNGNWAGTEVKSYTNEKGCNEAAADCWKESQSCYDTAPVTGHANCEIWEAKCESIRSACDSNSFQGPPNAGEMLTPALKKVITPAAVNERSSSSSASSAKSVPANPPVAENQPTAPPPSDPDATSPTHVETDKTAECGEGKQKCEGEIGDLFGSCCSAHGWCGRTKNHCGSGCQSAFGECRQVKREGRWIGR
ncbi:hypothetical protein HYFRA_00004526 [Hymenoscyphus fraxineus]|uniref:AA9 family lytic polysaccharide monooxygenase n=1 Tax=Hymenoscyphus fraxineus TaxID=746836 RepID=A0A9N9PUK8_9HELO|nr:hypothetical protein HYFRA_00004526 [Hymenoscyphus fraxineus]